MDLDTQRRREAEFDAAVDNYLDQLTRTSSLDDLLRIVREAALWARDAHRADMARKNQGGGHA